MTDGQVTIRGVRDGADAYIVFDIRDQPPRIIPTCPCCVERGRPGWDWGRHGEATDHTADMIGAILFNDPKPPLRYVFTIAALLAKLPREGFEMTATDVLAALYHVFGEASIATYVAKRVALTACQERL